MAVRSFLCALVILAGAAITLPASAGTTPDGLFSTGTAHACRILPDKSLSCWGSNLFGESDVPPGQYKAVSAGGYYTCAVRTDGTLACWGNGQSGATTLPATSQRFRFISAGTLHACAMSEDTFPRTVCWGRDIEGQTNPGIVDTYAHVSAHAFTSCGVRLAATIPDHEAWYEGPIHCWGDTSEHITDIGQVLEYPTERWFIQVATGFKYVCGIWRNADEFSDNLGCWGRNEYGLTREEPSGYFTQVSVSDLFACALHIEGTIACWGDNSYGQTNAPAGNDWAAVSVGGEYACGIRKNGSAYCWGKNLYGAVARPTLIPATIPSGVSGVYYSAGLGMYDGSHTQPVPGYSAGGQVYTLASGTLPPGVSLSSDPQGWAGVIAGTPKFGNYTFTVRAQDKNGFVAMRQYTLTIEGSSGVGGPFPPDVLRDTLIYISAQNLPTNIVQTLSTPLEGALRIVADSKSRNDPRACAKVESFLEKVEKKETRAKISAALATELHIRGDQLGVVLGCW